MLEIGEFYETKQIKNNNMYISCNCNGFINCSDSDGCSR